MSGSEHFGVARGLHSLAQPANQTALPMMNLAQPPKLDEFFERLRAAPARALILDYDGTLAPFERHPGCAVPYAGVRPLVDAIMTEPSTRVVVVSGRWTIDLLPVLGFERVPELWASHGWERLSPEGWNMLVRPEFRQTAADAWVQPPAGLLAFLERWHACAISSAA